MDGDTSLFNADFQPFRAHSFPAPTAGEGVLAAWGPGLGILNICKWMVSRQSICLCDGHGM